MSENDKAPNTGHYASKVERYLERMESKPPIDPAHQALLNRLKEIRRAALPAVNVHTVLINDPEYAPVLAQRHKRLMVKDFVLEFGENGTVDDLHTLQKSIEANGGFFQLYSNTFVRDRIENSVQDPNKQGWIIAESLGQARKEDLSLGPEIAGGDIQLWIPSIRIRILIKELMLDKKKGDSFDRNGRDVWKEVAERPAEAAWISDVCSLRGSDAFGDEYHPPLGFAKAASERVFYEIRRINQERRIPIRWVLSAVAEVTHILDSSKKPVTVFDPTLLNQKGIDLTKRNRAKRGGGVYRNVYLGAQKARDMLIERIGGDPGFLRFNWHILAQEVWQEGDPPPRIEDQV